LHRVIRLLPRDGSASALILDDVAPTLAIHRYLHDARDSGHDKS
jgi:hypothetical protein